MAGWKKEPPRLMEALGCIRNYGGLGPMKITATRVVNLLRYMDDKNMVIFENGCWQLTPRGAARINEQTAEDRK